MTRLGVFFVCYSTSRLGYLPAIDPSPYSEFHEEARNYAKFTTVDTRFLVQIS